MKNQNWFCIETSGGFEKLANDRLQSRHIQTLYPRQIKLRHYFGNPIAKPVEVPLYPRYLFAYCTLEQYQYAAIGQRREVLRLLDFGNGPATVPDELIEEVRARLDGDQVFIESHPEFEQGDAVRIINHKFYSGYTGIFQRGDKERVWALLRAIDDSTLHETVVEKLVELPRSTVVACV